jgi:GTPase Era involved in 16S rRNA processing
MAVAAAKVDAAVPEQLDKLKEHCRKEGYHCFPISSVTGTGLDQLMNFLADKVEEGRKLREAEIKAPETVIEGE